MTLFTKRLIWFVVALILAGGWWMGKNKPVDEVATPSPVAETKSCYEYIQVATETAPYSVEEHVVLNFEGNIVHGTKEGTQAGPDMTNGYSGNLTGTKSGQSLELLFSYTIEGSDNKELELYEIRDEDLIKLRYVLKDQKGILVPDESSTPRELIYKKITCS